MKNQFIINLFGICLLAFGLSACDALSLCTQGEGEIVSETLELSDISGIDLEIAGRVYLSEGSEQSIEVRGYENLVEKLRLESNVRNDIWHIGFQNGCYDSDEQMEFFITVPNLTHVAISGSGEIIGESTFETEQLDMNISGSGMMELKAIATQANLKISGSGKIITMLESASIESKISGSGDIKLEGSADTQNLDIIGSGSYEGFGMETSETTVDISGSGDAEVKVSSKLRVDISGGGNVYYKGDAGVDAKISGSGKIIDAN